MLKFHILSTNIYKYKIHHFFSNFSAHSEVIVPASLTLVKTFEYKHRIWIIFKIRH